MLQKGKIGLLLIALSFVCGAAVRVYAAAVPGAERFGFVVPGDDAIPSATDMSKLSPKPAGADGFVTIRDGKFYTNSGRLKIWGVNTCFGGNFPTHEQAEKVAAHLAKLGVNGVRMHHHDTVTTPHGIWGKIVNGKRMFDPQQLDRQDYFLDQFHKHGIYVNLNLHVGRTFTEAEGFLSKDLPRSVRYNKYLLYYQPRMRKLFKEFCRMYLTHRNPYRKLRRVDDPGIAMLELTNENSFSTLGPSLAASLPEPYRSQFKQQWNAWLKKRYGTTEALKKSWKDANEPLGEDLANMGDWSAKLEPWILRQDANFTVEARLNQPGPQPDVKALKLDIIKQVAQIWHQELMLTNLSVEKDKLYTLSFWVKADRTRTIYVDVSNQGPDNWRDLGFRETLRLAPQWTHVRRTFRAHETITNNARVCFKFGGSDIDLYLAQVRLRHGGRLIVLHDDQTIEQCNIEIPIDGWVNEAQKDVRQFMVDTEKGFINEMVAFLKNDLGVKVPITASQIDYHGAAIVADTCDYADIHAYWQHPHFPGRPWDSRNWTIGNTPMECAPCNSKWPDLSLLTRTPWRLLDRPFTISEWNIPNPSDYAASVVPFAAMVAALQDWDAVFFFDYHSSENNWFADRLLGYFSFNGQPVKLALLTACANMYRRGDLKPLMQTAAGTFDKRLPAALALSHRIGINPKARRPQALKEPACRHLASPDGRVVWDASDRDLAHVMVNTPASRAVWGLIAGRTFDLGGLKISVGQTEHNYAAIIITSLDGRRLEESRRMLLTVVGSAENLNMVWNKQRSSVSDQWGTGPTHVNGIPADLMLPSHVRAIYALDGCGQRLSKVRTQTIGRSTRFSIGPEHKTLWYEIVAE